MLPVAILAGGLASRLKPISETIPKSLIEINHKPFLEWQLDLLEKNACEQVVLCISHKSELIESYIKSRPKSNLEISFSWDGEKQLGTGGAIIKARKILGSEFMVLYGDSYLPIDFNEVSEFFIRSKKLALMTVLKSELGSEPSNVFFEDGFVRKYNKSKNAPTMQFTDFGLNAFKSCVFDDYIEGDFLDLSLVQEDLSTRNELIGFQVYERYYEVGSFSGIHEFESYTKGL